MIEASDFKVGMCFKINGEYFRLVSFELVTAGGKAGSHYNTKLRNLKTNATAERHFKATDKFEDIEIIDKKKQFLYQEGDNLVFMDPETFEQFSYPKKNLGKSAQFLAENSEVTALYLGDELLSVEVPQFMNLTISSTVSGVSGSQSGSVYKPATLENGIEILVPPFIKQDEKVRVDTHTGQYVERIKEKS
ncbi:MAG: elongation factor P [Elusimicrobia bacterium]|nr:elongation factor P [Elusimicrobiota bacterium]MBD3412448.1 elongation factor P [Elusimicrobiota bacterium]